MRVLVGLFSVFLAGAACGDSSPTSSGGNNNPPPPPGPTMQTVNMTDHAYSPPSPTIKAGTSVKWINTGATVHTATSDAGVSPPFNSGQVSAPGTATDPYGGGTTTTPGGSFTTTFSTPGTYPYHCTFHGTANNMRGTITVTP